MTATKAVDKTNGIKTLSDAQVKRLYTIASKKGFTTADVKTHISKKYNKVSVSDLTKKEYDEAVAGYEKLEDKK